nr:uncharacterized protein LOC109158743 [Ipomoea trifida]
MPPGVSAEEANLLQRSKKKTKRGLFERDNDPMDMEEEDPANSMPNESKTGKEQVDQNNKALKNLEEDTEEEAQEEYTMMERPDGPTGAILSGKGKRPQTHTTEAQLLNDKSVHNRENAKGRQTLHKTKERSKSTKRNKKQTYQAAETDTHTVVRGYDKGTRVEKTTIDEEGSKTEVFHDRTETGDHHYDPSDSGTMIDTGTWKTL